MIGFPIEYHGWEFLDGAPVILDGGKLRVTINPTSHLDGLRELIDPAATDRFRAYSLAFDWRGGKRLIYSADLGRPEDMAALLKETPCDLLVCELAHFEPEELFRYLRHKPVRRLVLTHLTEEFSARAQEIEAMGAKMLPKMSEVAVMRDGVRVEF